MSKTTVFEYQGASETVTWDRRLCIHVGECGRAEGDLFENGRKPWCDPDAADRDEAVAVVSRCPTGALAVRDEAGAPIKEPAPAENQMTVSNDGPLYASGDLTVDGASDDMHSVSRRVALCRCGASKNKPFCDNSHREIAFQDAGAVGDTGLAEIEAVDRWRLDAFRTAPLRFLEISRSERGPAAKRGQVGRLIFAGVDSRPISHSVTALIRCRLQGGLGSDSGAA